MSQVRFPGSGLGDKFCVQDRNRTGQRTKLSCSAVTPVGTLGAELALWRRPKFHRQSQAFAPGFDLSLTSDCPWKEL